MVVALFPLSAKSSDLTGSIDSIARLNGSLSSMVELVAIGVFASIRLGVEPKFNIRHIVCLCLGLTSVAATDKNLFLIGAYASIKLVLFLNFGGNASLTNASVAAGIMTF